MSSAVVSTSAAQSRLFIFDDEFAPEMSSHPDEVFCHPERSGKCEKRISRGVEGSLFNDSRLAHITPASRLAIRPAPEMIPSGIAALDTLTGGLPRGCITEICGPASSGRTSLLLAALSAVTHRGECCALIDAADAFDPHSTTAAAVDLDRLLWVRCGGIPPQRHHSASLRACPEPAEGAGSDTEKKISEEPLTQLQPSSSVILSAAKDPLQVRAGSGPSRNFHPCPAGSEHRLEQVLRTTDLLIESGGFGLIALDLADVPAEPVRRIPLTTWFRFRRAIEHTPTILLVIEPQPIAGSCSSLLLQLRSIKNSGTPDNWKQLGSSREAAAWESPAWQCRVEIEKKNESRRDGMPDEIQTVPTHTQLFTGLDIHVELIRSRHDRKPSHSVAFETRTAWAG
jgi:recombination protein RecA